MTGLEILLSIALYIALGLWICQKREWYYHPTDNDGDRALFSLIAILFMPINLLIVFIKEFILRKWDN